MKMSNGEVYWEKRYPYKVLIFVAQITSQFYNYITSLIALLKNVKN